jgi:membrane-associated phospholipid phosphatase
MKTLFVKLKCRESLRKAIIVALVAGVLVSTLVLITQPTRNELVWSIGNFLGSLGNDVFLVLSNLFIIGWAWRKRLRSVIKLTLMLDLFVWISVQGIKMMHIEPWYLRPNGGTGGFPSGHATHAFAMAFLLTLFFPRFCWVWYSCAAAIAWSRVETDWHTGFQVTAGIVLGIMLVLGLVIRWLDHPEASIIQSKTREAERGTILSNGQQSYAAE